MTALYSATRSLSIISSVLYWLFGGIVKVCLQYAQTYLDLISVSVNGKHEINLIELFGPPFNHCEICKCCVYFTIYVSHF